MCFECIVSIIERSKLQFIQAKIDTISVLFNKTLTVDLDFGDRFHENFSRRRRIKLNATPGRKDSSASSTIGRGRIFVLFNINYERKLSPNWCM